MSDRLLIGPYRHLTLSDGTDVPFYMIPFDKNGVCQGPKTLNRLIEDVESGRFTDVFLFSHGWNTDWQAAVSGYERFQNGFTQMHKKHDLSIPDGYRPLLVGIFWPSIAMAFGEDETGPQIAGSDIDSDDVAVAAERRAIQELALELPREQAERFYALTQLDLLTEDDALELATIAQTFYRAEDDELGISEPSSPEDILDLWLAAADELNPGDVGAQNDDGPSVAGFGDLLKKLDPRQIVNLLTVYQMKDRAGTVGALGVGPMLRNLLGADDECQIHLLGHSYGCKVVLSALCHPQTLPRQVDSVLLLQPAVNHLCFAENVLGRGHSGGYRNALKRVNQPILSTFSRDDFPLHTAFHLALRRRSDIGEVQIAGADAPPSRFAALGGYGPRGAGEELIQMPDVGEPYELDMDVGVYGVDGSGLITSHSDVSNPATWWVLHQQLRM